MDARNARAARAFEHAEADTGVVATAGGVRREVVRTARVASVLENTGVGADAGGVCRMGKSRARDALALVNTGAVATASGVRRKVARIARIARVEGAVAGGMRRTDKRSARDARALVNSWGGANIGEGCRSGPSAGGCSGRCRTDALDASAARAGEETRGGASEDTTADGKCWAGVRKRGATIELENATEGPFTDWTRCTDVVAGARVCDL